MAEYTGKNFAASGQSGRCCAVQRGDALFIPDGKTVFEEKDVLVISKTD